MTDRLNSSLRNSTSGAIDVMYFPPARRDATLPDNSQFRCQEPIEPAIVLKRECGLDYVFVTQCKRWLCDRHMFCGDAHLDDVLRYTSPYPEHFIGIGSYNPLDFVDSTHQAEIGIQMHGFRGIYVHPGSFGVSLNDRRMYPLYVKSQDWQVPVILDVRVIGDENYLPRGAEMQQVATDFPDVNFVIAQPLWSIEEMMRIADNFANVYFCFDTPALLTPAPRSFVASALAHGRCMWGSNGLPWNESLSELKRLAMTNATGLLRDNAVRLFALEHLPTRQATPFLESEEAPPRIVAE
jgi:predicted TIM-barrel fold metal-dependent hydrolase